MVLRKTVHSEIPELTRISKAAFDTDNLVGYQETGRDGEIVYYQKQV